MTAEWYRWLAGMVVVFSLGIGLGPWLHRRPRLEAQQASLQWIRSVTAPHGPEWRQ
jgi:hypothetical protein